MNAPRVIVFDNSALVPTEWRLRAGQGPIWAFNPEQTISNVLIGVSLAFAVGAVAFWNF